MRLVIIGLDGANFNVLSPLMERGLMPNLKMLISNGCYGELESVIPPVTAPAWASFSTGKHPVKHGCFFFTLPRDRLDDFRPATSEDINGDTFYEFLDNPVLINLPSTYPPRIDGIIITSLLTQGDDFIFPNSLKEEIKELNDYRIIADESLHVRNKIDDYIRDIRKLEKNRFECTKRIFNEKPWKFFFVLFSGSDWVQHWRYKELIDGTNKEAEEMFKDLDNYLGWFVKNLPEDSNLFVVSDHGFKNYKRKFYINKWLEKEGYLFTMKGYEEAVDKSMKERIVEDYLRKFKGFNVGRVAKFSSKVPFIYKILKRLYLSFVKVFPSFRGNIELKFDNKNSKARAIWGGIYINDRRFGGIVKDKDRIADEIVEKLKDLKDPITNRRVMRDVWRKDELFRESSDKVPDIIFDIRDHELSYFLVSHAVFDSVDSSHHSPSGIFIAYGKDIRKGEIKRANLVDIAPTILHYYNKEISRDVDGKVLDIYNANSRIIRRKIKYKEKDLAEEKNLIKSVIKNLGM